MAVPEHRIIFDSDFALPPMDDGYALLLALNRAPIHRLLGLVEAVEETNELYSELARCGDFPRLAFCDPFAAEPRLQVDESLFRLDSLHFNAEGYALLTRTLRPTVERLWNERAVTL